MKILELQANNVKRLKAVEVKPDGSTVVVGGRNGAGKSSVLDSIVYVLGGASGIPGKPIREGEESASITITLDSEPNLIVTRKFSDSGKTQLEVKQVDENGIAMKVSSPQKMLDKLCSAVAFDPLAFTRLRPQEQIETLRKVLGVDVSDLDTEADSVFEERAAANRGVKAARGTLESLPKHDGVPDVEVSVVDLVKKLEEAQAINWKRREAFDEVKQIDEVIDEVTGDLKATLGEVDRLKGLLSAAEQRVAELTAKRDECRSDRESQNNAAELLCEIDCDPIHEQIRNAESTNAKVRDNQHRADVARGVAERQQEADDLTERLESLRNERVKRLSNAEWPVDGLGFNRSGVIFHGLPFEQCSSAEQLRISTAIGLAQHPELRVMLIHDGSLLDDDSLAAVAEMAAEHDAQVWIERVGDGEECTVVIEDGEVVPQPKMATA